MFLYFGKNYTTATVGERIVGVRCERCGCDYFFQLTRIGSAETTAAYGLGQHSARERSAQSSEKDTLDRLKLEAELVPCPKCLWINDELVRGFRLGRYRNWGVTAMGGAFVGISISLIAAWFIWIGPESDRYVLPYFLIYGPLIIAVLAAGVIALRRWLRSRIQPNRLYPLPPRLPRGTPPALILDESTGELVEVPQVEKEPKSVDHEIEMQIGRHEIPSICNICLEPADADAAILIPVLTALQLQIPRCSACAGRASRRRRWVFCLVTCLTLAAEIGTLFILRLEKEEFWIFSVVAVPLALAIGGTAAHLHDMPVRVKVVDASRGVIRIRFKNSAFSAKIPWAR